MTIVDDASKMPCLVCSAEQTIRAHLIPRCFAQEVRGTLEDHVIVDANGRYRWTKTGIVDQDILCGKCDSYLGANEGYSFEVLKIMRAMTAGRQSGAVEFGPVDTDKLLRFIAGVVWKYAVTRPELGRIKVKAGRLKKLKDAAFGGPMPPFFDAFVWRMATGNADTWFYRVPLVGDVDGIKFVRFSVGNFQLLSKIDQRKAKYVFSEFWLKGREDIVFPVNPMHLFPDFEGWFRAELENDNLRNGLARKRTRVGLSPIGTVPKPTG